MGAVHLPKYLSAAVERHVAAGRAESADAFVEDAVLMALQLVGEPTDELLAIARDGIADIEAGRYVEVTSDEDRRRLSDAIMAEVRDRLARSAG